MIVPVWLSHQNMNDNAIVYAVLDNQSDACFIKESILESINVTGQRSIIIKVATMLGEEAIESIKVSGLSVRSINESCIEQPCVYSREAIPARRQQIPKKNSALRWPHL